VADFAVEAIDEVTLDLAQDGGPLAGHDLMSPYVWTDETGCRMLVRVVPRPLGPDDHTGVIYCADSTDRLHFRVRPEPAISPGPDFVDAGGVEDPTVVVGNEGNMLVYFTGVDGKREQGSLLVARGPSMDCLGKFRVALQAPEGEGNIKEATVAQAADGTYRLFFEYARDRASRIGMATGPGPDGPWEPVDDPFGIRDGKWDNWHLSTGPIVAEQGRDPVMFYNGATKDARWRIGWITIDANFDQVTDRCIEPLIIPPPEDLRSATDIGFAASCLVDKDGMIRLYFSIADRNLRRATIRAFD
jgi:predicted GH43/DUF377 family glycosyl hydrolase